MNLAGAFLELHDLDQLLTEADDPARAARWRKLGYALEPSTPLHRERGRLTVKLDRRWLALYERSLARYGRGLSAVRNRVCLGCRLTLPTAAAPPPGEAHLHLCEGCGRLLLWD
jgi:predicted  nucleic acid-binding Zn-ribbon protein